MSAGSVGVMLFVLTGSNAAGKTAVLADLAARVENLALHDFDAIGVPPGADTRWRHRATEEWAKGVLAYQAEGRDSLVTGQSPLGEWLAVPSATQIDGIAACLLDVSDAIRAERLARRPRWLGSDRVALPRLLGWAEWHRAHARDPQCRQEVIQQNAWDEMCWERWRRWARGDSRWDILTVDTLSRPSMRLWKTSRAGSPTNGYSTATQRCL